MECNRGIHRAVTMQHDAYAIRLAATEPIHGV
jgi:hypothetical protein